MARKSRPLSRYDENAPLECQGLGAFFDGATSPTALADGDSADPVAPPVEGDQDDDVLDPTTETEAAYDHLVLPPIPEEAQGHRLDKWLAQQREDLSRSRIKSLLEDGHIAVNGTVASSGNTKLTCGDILQVRIPPATPALPEPQDIPLDVVYEDDDLIVINKPAGMVVHPAPGSPDKTLVNALLFHCQGSLSGIGGVARPGIVHRIDKDTSGLLVVAKTDIAHRGLAEQFAAHSLRRAYWAVVWGSPLPTSGEIRGNIGRSPQNRQKMAVVKSGGKEALTRYKVVETFQNGAASLIECRLATGRTHQIRVHMTSIGHALIGDPLYGAQKRRKSLNNASQIATAQFNRQALHAYELGFFHPVSGNELIFHSDLTSDISDMIKTLRS